MPKRSIFQHDRILVVENGLTHFFECYHLIAPLYCYLKIKPIYIGCGCNRKFWNMCGVAEFLQLRKSMNGVTLILNVTHHGDKPSFFHHISQRKIIIVIVPLFEERGVKRA